MDTPDVPPSRPSPSKTPSFGLLVAGILIVFVAIAIVAGLIARRSGQESAQLTARIDALQRQVDALRVDVTTLIADSERSAVLSFTDGGYFPVRTNGGTLLVAVANVEPVGNAMRVHLRIGNPQSLTYLGFTLAFQWDKGKGQQAFREVLQPGTWIVVPVMLAPADPATTTSLRITSASVDEISAGR